MKQLFTIFVFTLLTACSSQEKTGHTITEEKHSIIDSSSKTTSSTKADTVNLKLNLIHFQTSTYDDPEFEKETINHRESLKLLSDKGVFDRINDKLVLTLTANQKDYFKTKPAIKILSIAKGDLFHNNKEDYAFIVYDNKNQRISLLTFNAGENKYLELFRELKVENGLEAADCNYGTAATLDYQLGAEIIYQEEYLIKKPENYLEYPPIKIVNPSLDSDFILKSGCFSKKVSKTKLSTSLCIATSSVYNNWECLKYDKVSESFLIYYGQAFAD